MEELNSIKEQILAASRPEYLYVKLNGNNDKKSPIKVKLSSTTKSVEEFINEDIVKKHMSRGKNYPGAKLYS